MDVSKFMKRKSLLSIAIMAFFFFLPWVSLGHFINLSGYELIDFQKSFGSIMKSLGYRGKNITDPIYTFLLYLIPISAGLSVFEVYNDLKIKGFQYVASASPFLFFFYILIKEKDISRVLATFSIGFYFTLIAATFLFLTTLNLMTSEKMLSKWKKMTDTEL